MVVGQGVLSAVLDVPSLVAVQDRLVAGERERGAGHARLLRDALTLQRLYAAAGQELSAGAELALLWGCSEARAYGLLTDAEVLAELAGAWAALEDGVLRVEQSRAVVELLSPLDPVLRDTVWVRLLARLRADADR